MSVGRVSWRDGLSWHEKGLHRLFRVFKKTLRPVGVTVCTGASVLLGSFSAGEGTAVCLIEKDGPLGHRPHVGGLCSVVFRHSHRVRSLLFEPGLQGCEVVPVGVDVPCMTGQGQVQFLAEHYWCWCWCAPWAFLCFLAMGWFGLLTVGRGQQTPL